MTDLTNTAAANTAAVSNFVSNFSGGARPNRFLVDITFPSAVTTAYTDLGTTTKYMITATTIPSSTISPCPVYYMGRSIKVAGDREFEDWSVNVINDSNFTMRNAFEYWSTLINHHENNVSFSAEYTKPSTYYGAATIKQYSQSDDDTALATYEIKNILPINIGAISLDWGANNMVEMFPVVFAINYWKK